MLYQTNAAKENMKVQLRTEAAPAYVESYVYEPGFFRYIDMTLIHILVHTRRRGTMNVFFRLQKKIY